MFTLTSADDFSDFRNQNIHRADRLPILVTVHVKRFD